MRHPVHAVTYRYLPLQWNLEGGILAPVSDGAKPTKAKGKAAKASGKAKPKAKPLTTKPLATEEAKENATPQEQASGT